MCVEILVEKAMCRQSQNGQRGLELFDEGKNAAFGGGCGVALASRQQRTVTRVVSPFIIRTLPRQCYGTEIHITDYVVAHGSRQIVGLKNEMGDCDRPSVEQAVQRQLSRTEPSQAVSSVDPLRGSKHYLSAAGN